MMVHYDSRWVVSNLDLDDLISQISKSTYYKPKISTVAIENTHLASGGTIIPFQKIKQLSEFTKSNDLKLHVDGARVWHAILEEKTKNNYGKYCDSLTFCFSKGLGAPIGSMLLGSKDFIANSREYRKKIGGGMRQVGIIASAAKYALENRSTLILDHQMAKDVFNVIENVVNKIDCIESVVYKGTNMILLNFDTLSNSDEFLRYLSDNDIKAGYLREKVIRFVFHKDITSDNKEKLIETVQSFS